MATVRLVNRSRSCKYGSVTLRRIGDLCIGEIGYTVPWALELNTEQLATEKPGGTATKGIGVKRVGVNDWEVWVEE